MKDLIILNNGNRFITKAIQEYLFEKGYRWAEKCMDGSAGTQRVRLASQSEMKKYSDEGWDGILVKPCSKTIRFAKSANELETTEYCFVNDFDEIEDELSKSHFPVTAIGNNRIKDIGKRGFFAGCTFIAWDVAKDIVNYAIDNGYISDANIHNN